MKKIIIFIVMLIVLFTLTSCTTSSTEKRTAQILKTKEKVFIQIPNSLYKKGDTIYIDYPNLSKTPLLDTNWLKSDSLYYILTYTTIYKAVLLD
jgi:hypothetical protein